MNSADYIELLKKQTKTGSIYAVAKLLELNDTTVRHYAKGRREFDTYAALRVAELLNIEPMQVIADVEAAREKDESRRRYWKELAKKSAGLIATVVFAITLLTLPDANHSQQSTPLAIGAASLSIDHSINMASLKILYMLTALWILSMFYGSAKVSGRSFASAQPAVGAG